jgi:hypothetical protein
VVGAGRQLDHSTPPMYHEASEVSDVLMHAACGLPVAPGPGLLSSLLLGGAGHPSTQQHQHGLSPNQVCRLLLHAGSQEEQLEVGFTERYGTQAAVHL